MLSLPHSQVQMKYKGLPFLGPSPDSFLRHIAAKECCGRPPVTFQRVERVGQGLATLQRCNLFTCALGVEKYLDCGILSCWLQVQRIVDVLKSCNHNGYVFRLQQVLLSP
jgi:hypothetical protein